MVTTTSIGAPLERIEGRLKVRGAARYAYEQNFEDSAYLHPVQATIARGTIASMNTSAAEAAEGVIAVFTHKNAPQLADTDDHELAILQSGRVAFRGQIIGGVVAETAEIARHAASLVEVAYDVKSHDSKLRGDSAELHEPSHEPDSPTEINISNVELAMSTAAVAVDHTYTTPMEHNNPMEPHTSVAIWAGDADPVLTLYDSTQGAHVVRTTLAPILGLEPDQIRVVAPYVGGAFGSKGLPHAHNILAAMAAQLSDGRPVKLALTRQQMFSLAGYRTPTIQRIRLGADSDGRLSALGHDSIEQTSTIKEFAEGSSMVSRMMYAAPNRHTSQLLATLDVPVPSWMRAPGECPGTAALEMAMDELAVACDIDPVELRIRNDPEADPDTGKPWSSRHLVECLRLGAERFGWDQRGVPGGSRDGDWQVGLGVASATYPGLTTPGSQVCIEYLGDAGYAVRIGAVDIGTGTWTALTQIAADQMGCHVGNIRLEIGDTNLPNASVEGGSSGIASWGSTIVAAAREFQKQHGAKPERGAQVQVEMPVNHDAECFAVHSFGAHFAEVRINVDTGEIRVPRMLGVFSAGRIINARTARSQFIGGMTMGLSMALHEESIMDHRFGHVVNHDFAEYHIAANADVPDVEAIWLDEEDEHANPLGAKGIGEIGIVGAPAAIVNAAYNATGIRVRDLPLTADKFLR